MYYRQVFFIALGPIFGVSGVQYFFGNLTLLNFLLSLVVFFLGHYLWLSSVALAKN